MSADNGVYILKTIAPSNTPPSIEELRDGIGKLLETSISDIKGAIETLLATSGSKRYEYRVKHLQAVDNVYWDPIAGECCAMDDQCIINARDMWEKELPVFSSEWEAQKEAARIHDEVEYTEYGICWINIDRVY